MLKKYDSFFLLLSTICFFISFVCLETFNIPQEDHNYYDFTLSENLNNYYMSGKIWKIELGLYMLFTGIGMIGIIWITDLDIKMEYLYNGIKYRIRKWRNRPKGL